MASEERVLTATEKRRLERYSLKCKELECKGYTKTDLTMSAVKANIGALYGLIIAIPFIVTYVLRYDGADFDRSRASISSVLSDLVVFLVLIVVHELIHGVTWSRFTKKGFKDIEFGVIWKYLTPYCTCSEPLTKWQYILGVMMPGLLLGIVPCIVGCINNNVLMLTIGVLMTIAAGGDILIVKMILDNKTSKTALYLDHPTEVGLVVFQK
ncbi:DUF3267 domain-containing protein [Mogibacterium pumilum]|uniref:Zincin peptidase n=1 Tax=Mogibacterium pumilum TaxID=86332 RepID=A0A223AR97_9FIRM|nr:DUF3267 domain-containing protein [Mogibacterium pumilum]ASS37493.1 hypothetical protein AXF17_02795 [Mogibacterium pumilum]